ncbi:hypothetical protein KY329_05395 [Candidatus Woesearchaeota archaeon]|nr:hypothetical protein [Candidatus Woesearchaeota archaeon]
MAKHEICEEFFRPTRRYFSDVYEFGKLTGIVFPQDKSVVVEAKYPIPANNLTQLASSGFNAVFEALKDKGAALKAVSLNLRTPDDNIASLARECASQADRRKVVILDYNWDIVGPQITTPYFTITGLGEIPSAAAKNVQRSSISLSSSQIAELCNATELTFLDLNTSSPMLSAFNPKGRAVFMSACSLGKKAPWYTLNDSNAITNPFRAASSDVCALIDYNLEKGVDTRALVAFPHFSGNRRFMTMEEGLERLAQQQDILTRMVYSDHPKILQGFYKHGPMYHVDVCLISIYDQSKDICGSRFDPLIKGQYAYAINLDNPRLAGLDLHERILGAMHGSKAWPKNYHAKWLLRNFLTQPSVTLTPYLRELKSKGIIAGIFLPTEEGSALLRFGQALSDNSYKLNASYTPSPNSIERHLLEFAKDEGIMNVSDALKRWTYGTGGIVTSRNKKLQIGLPLTHIGTIESHRNGEGGLLLNFEGKEYRFP